LTHLKKIWSLWFVCAVNLNPPSLPCVVGGETDVPMEGEVYKWDPYYMVLDNLDDTWMAKKIWYWLLVLD